jgi:hypothetical protein
MQTTITLEFLMDTGASSMRIFDDDRDQIEMLSGAPVPIIGEAINQTASGLMRAQNVVLQVMIFQNDQPLLPHWVNVKAGVTAGRRGGPGGDRLSGVWIYHLLFVMSMPDNTGRTHIGTDIGEMLANLPIPDHKNAIPPPLVY